MPFIVNNFAIRTWNVALVSECRFVFENVIFVSEICVLVVEQRWLLRIYSSTFATMLNSGILPSGSTKCGLSQKAVSSSESSLYFEISVADVCHHKSSASSRILYCGHPKQYSHPYCVSKRPTFDLL